MVYYIQRVSIDLIRNLTHLNPIGRGKVEAATDTQVHQKSA